MHSVLQNPRDTSQPEQLLGARPALKSQRASVVTGRAARRVNCHLVSIPETVKSFLSQLYRNSSLQIGRTLPWHYISLKSFSTAHIYLHRIPGGRAGASAIHENKLWSYKRGSDSPRAIPSWLRKPDLLPGLHLQAPALVDQERPHTLPNAHIKEYIS